MFSCKNDDIQRNPFLYEVSFSHSINLNLPEYNNLNFAGGSIYLPYGGINGIIVFNLNGNDIFAWEASCSNHKLESCSRFTNELTCNHANSYSLDLKGIKYKCQWLKTYIMDEEVGECKGISILENPEIQDFNITDAKFDGGRREILWKEAIQKSIDYVENIVKLKEISKDEINLLLKEQKIRSLPRFWRRQWYFFAYTIKII